MSQFPSPLISNKPSPFGRSFTNALNQSSGQQTLTNSFAFGQPNQNNGPRQATLQFGQKTPGMQQQQQPQQNMTFPNFNPQGQTSSSFISYGGNQPQGQPQSTAFNFGQTQNKSPSKNMNKGFTGSSSFQNKPFGQPQQTPFGFGQGIQNSGSFTQGLTTSQFQFNKSKTMNFPQSSGGGLLKPTQPTSMPFQTQGPAFSTTFSNQNKPNFGFQGSSSFANQQPQSQPFQQMQPMKPFGTNASTVNNSQNQSKFPMFPQQQQATTNQTFPQQQQQTSTLFGQKSQPFTAQSTMQPQNQQFKPFGQFSQPPQNPSNFQQTQPQPLQFQPQPISQPFSQPFSQNFQPVVQQQQPIISQPQNQIGLKKQTYDYKNFSPQMAMNMNPQQFCDFFQHYMEDLLDEKIRDFSSARILDPIDYGHEEQPLSNLEKQKMLITQIMMTIEFQQWPRQEQIAFIQDRISRFEKFVENDRQLILNNKVRITQPELFKTEVKYVLEKNLLAHEKISKLQGFGEHAIVETIKKTDAEIESQNKLLDQCDHELSSLIKSQKQFKIDCAAQKEDLKFLKDSIFRATKDIEKMGQKLKENLIPFCKQFITAWKKRENIEEMIMDSSDRYEYPREPTMENPEKFLQNAKVLFTNLKELAREQKIFAEKFAEKDENMNEIQEQEDVNYFFATAERPQKSDEKVEFLTRIRKIIDLISLIEEKQTDLDQFISKDCQGLLADLKIVYEDLLSNSDNLPDIRRKIQREAQKIFYTLNEVPFFRPEEKQFDNRLERYENSEKENSKIYIPKNEQTFQMQSYQSIQKPEFDQRRKYSEFQNTARRRNPLN